MTNKEAAIALLSKAQPDTSAVEFELMSAGIDPNALYSSANSQVIGGVAVDILAGMLAAPNISEGGFSISYTVDGVKELLLYLAKKYGRDDIIQQYTPTISSAKPW